MDLLRTVRKEGSRGGLNNFNWEEVSASAHRQNYLLHSIKAPVGRGQKNKDFSWYAKAEDADLTAEERAEKERVKRQEEMRKVKEAEEDAMAKALGLPVPDRTNANLQPLGMDKTKQSELSQVLKEALKDDGEESKDGTRVEGEHGRRQHDAEGRRRHRSRSKDREHRHRHRHRHHDRSRSRSLERDSRRHRSRSRDRRREDDRYTTGSRDRRRDEHRERRRRSRSRDRQRDNDRLGKHRSRDEIPRGNERDDRRRSTRSRSRSPYQRYQR